jgi:CheY-like chemotaxis protein
MEAVGRLAGGVAHDFNNLLAIIRGNIELALMDGVHLSQETGQCLKQAEAAVERAAGLTRQLLAFGRRQVMQTQMLDLNEVIAHVAKMLERIIGTHVELSCQYAAQPPIVQADAGMLEQVVVNLVVNARDAMPNGGKVVIATNSVQLDLDYAKAHPESRPGNFVSLTVSDNGSGIAPEHLPRIFEPFFSTKQVGKGTGLGLATVYGIVKQHQGWIEVSSHLGVGSSFRILLPSKQAHFARMAAAEAPEENPGGGSETILLVEDEEAVRASFRRLLEKFGYQVHEAASGRAALEAWSSRLAEIDLVLTDMIMPDGVNGHELAEAFLTRRPGLKVIFMSGYTGPVRAEETGFMLRNHTQLLHKPCSSQQLLKSVRQCLDRALAPVPA